MSPAEFKLLLCKTWTEVHLLPDPDMAMSEIIEPLLERALSNLSEQENDVLTHIYAMFMLDKISSN